MLPRLSTATYELVLVPSGIVGAQTVTLWRDESGRGRHATPSGAPATSLVGRRTAVAFDGVDDVLDGALALGADRPIAAFIVSRAITQDAATRVQVEISDTGATARSAQIVHGSGYRDVHMAQVGSDSAAYYTFASTSPVLHSYLLRQNDRILRENGRWKSTAANDAGVARAPTVYRIGGALGGGQFWQGAIAAVILVAGAIADFEVEELEASLLDFFELARPARWPSAGMTNDLHLVLPATIDAIVGEPVTLFKAGDTSVATSLPLDLTYPDRITVTPSAPGDASLAITDGGVQATATVHAVAALGGAAPARKVLFVGDSNGNQMSAGALEILRAELGTSKITFVGTQGPAQGYHVKHECRDGWGWNTFNNTDPLQPGTFVASPFFLAGSMNIPNYLAQLTAPPDVIVWMLGGNDVYGQTLATVDARITSMLVDAEALWAAWRAACPDVVQIITSPWVTSADPVVHGNSVASMQTLHDVNRRCVERLETALAGRTAERLYHRPTFARVDTFRGYRDSVHMNQSPGAAAVVRALKASLVARWPAVVASITSAVVDGAVSASKLTLNFDSAAHFPDLTGLSLSFTTGTPRTISSISSGNDSTSVVLNLSGAISGTDVFSVVVGATRTQTTVSGGERISTGTTGVTIQNLSNPVLSAPGTIVAWLGADSVTLTGSLVDTLVDKGPAGNTFTLGSGATKGTQSTTGGGHKKITTTAATWYERTALSVNVPANHSGTFYWATKVNNWTPSGGYGAAWNMSPDNVEGGGHYDAGFYVTPTAGARLKAGYGQDETLNTANFTVDSSVHVWAWTYTHDGTIRLYRDGVEIASTTMTPDPGALSAARKGTLFFGSHVCCEEDFYQQVQFVSADASAVHDASTVASISTYLASLTT